MKVENLVQNTKPVEEILDYKMKNKSLKGIIHIHTLLQKGFN